MDPIVSVRALSARLFRRGRRAAPEDEIHVVIDDRDQNAEPQILIEDQRPAFEPAVAYLVSEVAALLRRRVRDAASGDEPEGGILLLGPHVDPTSAAADLYDHALGDDRPRSAQLEASLWRTLGCRPRRDRRDVVVAALNEWLNHRFDEAQEAMASSPLVWHLSTPSGSFQVLVDATTFDADQAAQLRRHGVRSVLERLRMDVWHDRDADPERASRLRRHIEEIEDFDVGLFRLAEGQPGVPMTRARLEEAGVLGK